MIRPFLISSFLASASLQALYVGNPDLPGAIEKGLFTSEDSLVGFKLGYQADFVLDRRLKSFRGLSSRMDTFDAMANRGVLTCAIADRVEAYGSVGSMQASFSHRPSPTHLQREYHTNYKTVWGFGGRVIVYEWKGNVIGIQGAYNYAKLPLKWDSLSGVTFTTDAKLHYEEWQVSIGFAKEIDFLIPYFAFKYSDVSAKVSFLREDLQLGVRTLKMTNRDHFGFALGCTLTTGKYFDMTIESRFLDEQAITLAANVRF